MWLLSNTVLSKLTGVILIPLIVSACAAASQMAEAPDLDSNWVLADTGPEPTASSKTARGSTSAETPPETPPTLTLPPASILPDLGPAPDITNQVWFNSDKPLTLADLQGKVVLVEFWTFG